MPATRPTGAGRTRRSTDIPVSTSRAPTPSETRRGRSRPRRLGLDDDPARALGQDGLDALAEQRRPGPWRQRHEDRLRADRARLVDDDAASLAGADLDDAL